jgi:hypothetical protein
LKLKLDNLAFSPMESSQQILVGKRVRDLFLPSLRGLDGKENGREMRAESFDMLFVTVNSVTAAFISSPSKGEEFHNQAFLIQPLGF